MPNVTDYLQQPVAGFLKPVIGSWVRLLNNATAAAYVSTAITDANGMFTVLAVPPGGYTISTGPTSGGAWTSTGDANYNVSGTIAMFNVLDYGALGDNSTVNTTALQAAIDAAAVNGGIVYFPPGIFRTDTLTLKSKVYLQGAGQNATSIKQTSDVGGHHVIVTDTTCIDVGVFDVSFIGVGGVGGNTFGIAAGNNGPVSRIKVERCTFTLFSGSGLQFGGNSTNLVTDFTARACSFIDNAVNVAQPCGIAITNGQRGVIDGCNIDMTSADRAFAGANAGIDIEPSVDTAFCIDITITNTRIRNTGASGIQVLARATAINQTKGIIITGCEIFACAQDGILAGGASTAAGKGTSIDACSIHDNGRIAVRFFANDGILSNSRIVDNNRGGGNNGHITVEQNVQNSLISGCRIGYVEFAGGQMPVLAELSTGADYTLITGCNVRTGTGTVSFTFVGSNSTVLNCPGWNVTTTETNYHRFRYEPLNTAGINVTNVGTGATAAFGGGRGHQMNTGATNPSSTSQNILIAPSGGTISYISRIRRVEFTGWLSDNYTNSNCFWYMTDENVNTIPIGTARHLGIKNLNAVISFTTGDGATEQVTDISTGFPAAANELLVVITFDGAVARCFVGGALRATHSTNVPLGAGVVGSCFRAFINNNATANARTMAFYSCDVMWANS